MLIAGLRGKRKVAQNFSFGKSHPHFIKLNYRLVRGLQDRAGRAGSCRHRGFQNSLSARNSASFVRNVSATMIMTEDTTTACVVARPTPCVPPLTLTP